MSNTSTTVSGGISFTGLLTCIFVAAKLWDKIDWAWIWVFSPMWGGVALVLAVFAVVAAGAGIVYVVGSILDIPRKRRRRKNIAERHANMRRDLGL